MLCDVCVCVCGCECVYERVLRCEVSVCAGAEL